MYQLLRVVNQASVLKCYFEIYAFNLQPEVVLTETYALNSHQGLVTLVIAFKARRQ